MRRALIAALTVIVGAGLTLAPAGAQAVVTSHAKPASNAAAPGSYVAVTPYRAADTHTGVNGNRKGRLAAKSLSRISLAGHVPADASAAVVSLSEVGASTNGYLNAFQDGTSMPPVWTMLYRGGVTTTVTTVVSLAAAKFLLYDGATSGSTDFAVDVQGYYVGGAVSGDNVLHPATPRRLVSSTTTLGPGKSIEAHLGPNGVNSTVALTVHVVAAPSSGSVSVYPTGTSAPAAGSLYHPAGYGFSQFTQIRLGDDGDAVVANRGSGTIRVAVDQLGYSERAAAQAPGSLQPVAPTRIYSGVNVPAGRYTRLTLTGKAGLPQSGLGTALVTIVVGGTGAGGGIDAAAPGASTTGVRALSFSAGDTSSVQTPVRTTNGQLDVLNASGRTITLYLDVLGYYPSTTAPATVAGVGRYLTSLVDTRSGSSYLSTDTSIVQGWADKDAAAGAGTVLLDLGAQTYTAPLSSANPGVALAENATEPADGNGLKNARLNYADLATLTSAYLKEFHAQQGAPDVRVLLAVNNEGDWAAYKAAQRATDFAAMIGSVTVPAGSSIAAAGDFEPGFDDQQGSLPQNALTWKSTYQGSGATRPFVFIGAASGCPSTFGATEACTNKDSAPWSQAQLASLASGTNTTALPQIYFTPGAVQWANIQAHASTPITFIGTLSEFARATDLELTSDQAHAALYRGLSWVQTTPQLGSLTIDLAANGS